jgi:hypothetical protein
MCVVAFAALAQFRIPVRALGVQTYRGPSTPLRMTFVWFGGME